MKGLTTGRSERTGDILWFALLTVFAIVGAIAVAMLILAVTHSAPGDAFRSMVEGSFGSRQSFVTTLNHMGPILIVALGACIAGHASLVNIGQEGQLLIGASAAVPVGIWCPGPRLVVVPLLLAAGAIGGGFWSGVAALLRQISGVNEVITTLLLNFIAIAFVSYLVNRDWLLQEMLPKGATASASPQSDPIRPLARLPVIAQGSGYRLNGGIALALILALIMAVVIAKTIFGFRLRMYGYNPRAAVRAGVSRRIYGSGALILSGGFAGLAGAVLLAGTAFRVNPNLANNYGWEGLLVALVAGFSPIAAVFVALLFGALRAGGGVLAATGVSSSIVGVVQALIVLAVMLPSLFIRRRRRRRQLGAKEAPPPGRPVGFAHAG